MQIVIEIPNGLYANLQKIHNGSIASKRLLDCVRNGTPLPKGHGRLIDADNAISKICGSSCGCHLEECGHDEPCFSVTRIESVQTIIEADTENHENDDYYKGAQEEY